MEAAAAEDADAVLESMLTPAAPLDEEVSPVAGRRFSRS
jgi:hypothetical protein